MAIEAMVAVFKESRSEANDRLVMLALANQASAFGELSAYPRSQKYIAGLVNCSLSTVRRSLASLTRMGELEVVESGLGHSQSSYLLHLPSLCKGRLCVHGEGVWSTMNTPPVTTDEHSDYSRLSGLSVHGRAVHHSVLPSLPVSSADASQLVADALEGQGQELPPAAPPEQTFQSLGSGGMVVAPEVYARMPKWARPGFTTIAAREPAEPAASVSSNGAPSIVTEPSAHWRVKRPDKVEKLLQPHGVVIGSGQADQRALAKLAEMGPTRAQIDGACNTLLVSEGKVDIGRLVAKWDVLSQFGAPRPAAWNTKRNLEGDALKAHIEAGGDRYARDGAVDYGL